MTLKTQLRIARGRSGMTLDELATKCGVTPAALSQFERGRHRPSVRTLVSLADALGLDPEALFDQLDAERSQAREPIHA
jgi:transcriptional regulator with XRE-family HTH domain